MKFMISLWNSVMNGFSTIFSSMILREDDEGLGNMAIRPKLIYFNVSGLAQCIRDTFNYAGLDFEDIRLTKKEFAEQKGELELPFSQLPILDVNGDILCQSKSILRYVSRRCRTYASDAISAAFIDQFCDLHTEFMQPLSLSMYPSKFGIQATEFDKSAHRNWISTSHLPKYLTFLEDALSSEQWISGTDVVSMADFCWFPTLSWLQSGIFDGIGMADFENFPNIQKFMEDMRVLLNDKIEDTDAGETEPSDTSSKIEGSNTEKKDI